MKQIETEDVKIFAQDAKMFACALNVLYWDLADENMTWNKDSELAEMRLVRENCSRYFPDLFNQFKWMEVSSYATSKTME